MEGLSCRIKERIQPFERRLALQELRALAGGPVVPVDGDDATASTFSVARASDAGALREALAYWHSVGDRADGTTTQLRAEAALEFARHDAAGDGLPEILRARLLAKTSGKRRLRYATHGLHEYRGKFFPQLVRALMNIARLPEDAVVLDPMCGSGTTLVEARLSGRAARGLDMNPLSVFIADVKCRALALEPAALTEACDELRRVLDTDAPPVGAQGAPETRVKGDRDYLDRWFARRTLRELDLVDAAVRRLPTRTLRDSDCAITRSNMRGSFPLSVIAMRFSPPSVYGFSHSPRSVSPAGPAASVRPAAGPGPPGRTYQSTSLRRYSTSFLTSVMLTVRV